MGPNMDVLSRGVGRDTPTTHLLKGLLKTIFMMHPADSQRMKHRERYIVLCLMNDATGMKHHESCVVHAALQYLGILHD